MLSSARSAKAATTKRLAGALILALIAVAPARPQVGKPLTIQQIDGLLKGGVYGGRIAEFVKEWGISFKPTEDYLQHLRQLGADELLIQAVREAGHLEKPSSENGLAKTLALARQFDRQKNWPEAEEQYRAALRQAPRDAEVLAALGQVLDAENKPDEAIEEYRRAILLRSGLAVAHQGLGDAFAKKGDLKGAIQEYRAAVRLNPEDLDTGKKLAAAFYRVGDLDSAILEYRSLVQAQPKDAEIHYRFGLALYSDAQLNQAAAQFREALHLKPDDAHADAALGDVLMKTGKREGALAEYRKALQIDSSHPALRSTLDSLLKAVEQPASVATSAPGTEVSQQAR